jgi:hypothetical protein
VYVTYQEAAHAAQHEGGEGGEGVPAAAASVTWTKHVDPESGRAYYVSSQVLLTCECVSSQVLCALRCC